MVSDSWDRSMQILHANNFSFRAATSDRRVTPPEVKKQGEIFFRELEKHAHVRCELVFNMDEFFCHLDQNNHKWTWVRPKKGKPIQIGSSRLGFTCSAPVSDIGKFHGAQFIWKGATSTVHAKVSPNDQDSRIFQDHRGNSHFQDASTFARWTDWFKKKLLEIRRQIRDLNSPAVLIIDQAAQHGNVQELLERQNCSVVNVPAKMTHIFQPCDKYIIANIKRHST